MMDAIKLIESELYQELKNVRITGVMGMSSFSEDVGLVRKEFESLHDYFVKLKLQYFNHIDSFRHISMGMSGDYRIAIEEGATLLRLGTMIFGER
jgi:uncharacterized pyridoxal phosphate-containing UPF0001 family protein